MENLYTDKELKCFKVSVHRIHAILHLNLKERGFVIPSDRACNLWVLRFLGNNSGN